MNGKEKEDVEELKEVLSVVSKEVPNLIKSIIASVFQRKREETWVRLPLHSIKS